MQTNSFEQVQNFTGLPAHTLENLLITYVVEAAGRYSELDGENYLHWNLGQAGRSSRRLLVSFEPAGQVKVSFEVAYELFDGDIHHYVEQVGLVRRSEIASQLAPLVRTACHKLLGWKPTCDSIWN